MKKTNFTFYEPDRGFGDSFLSIRKMSKVSFFVFIFCLLSLPLVYANCTEVNQPESSKVETSIATNIKIQVDEKGKYIEIFNSPFLNHSENVIASKLKNNKKVQDVIIRKAEKSITIYFSKDLSDAEINEFARIYFNK